MQDIKMICFDLNKTLIEENSWLNLNLAMGVTQEEDGMLMKWGGEGVIDDKTGQNILCNIYRTRGDVSRQNIDKIIKSYTFVDGAEGLVKYCQGKGYEVALISGAMDSLVEDVAKRLNIGLYQAGNYFIYDMDDQLISIDAPENDGQQKAKQLEELCRKLGIDVKEVIVIGDGANDVELFDMTGRGITFIDSIISDKAWKVVDSLDDIKSII